MSRITDPINTIDWSWFTTLNIDEINITEDVTNVLSDIANVIETQLTDQEKEETQISTNNLVYGITGINNNNMVSQETWYNTWLTQSTPNFYSSSLLFIINKVKVTNDQSTLVSFVNKLGLISKFIIIRHFATPIPNSYLQNNAPVGTKPRLVDNQSIYYTNMTDTLQSFFLNYPSGLYGIGNDTIGDMCSNFSRSTISNYLPIKEWCGCFSPESTFTTKAKELYPDSSSYTKDCDPLCIYPDAIKIINGPTTTDYGSNASCKGSTLCVMSKFDLQTADSNGSINLTQNCPCAGPNSTGPCFCVIDSSIESLLNKTKAENGGSMADPITFKQYCPGAECFIADANGNLTQTACQSDNPGETNAITNLTQNMPTVIAPNIWYLLLTILLVGITLIQCARYIGREPKYKVKGLLKPKIKLSKNTRSNDIGFLKKT